MFATPQSLFSCTWKWHRWPCRKNHCKEHLLTSFGFFNTLGVFFATTPSASLRTASTQLQYCCEGLLFGFHFFLQRQASWEAVCPFFFFNLSLREHIYRMQCGETVLSASPLKFHTVPVDYRGFGNYDGRVRCQKDTISVKDLILLPAWLSRW